MDRVASIVRATPGVEHAVSIGGISVFDNNASLANAGAIYVIFKDWSERGRGAGSAQPLHRSERSARRAARGPRSFVVISAADPGHRRCRRLPDGGRAPGRQLRLRKLQNVGQAIADKGRTQSGIQAILNPFRAGAPQLQVEVDRDQGPGAGRPARRRVRGAPDLSGLDLRQPVQQVRPHLPGLRPGRPAYRVTPEEMRRYYVRNANGDMVPIGTWRTSTTPPGRR